MKILLPTDFSESSRNAAAYALQFFREIPCTFYLLHVSIISKGSENQINNSIPGEVQDNFSDLLSWLNDLKVNADHSFQIDHTSNFLIEAVREQVVQKNIDLIIMGTKGQPAKTGSIIGKNTGDVMMKVKCPALAISPSAVYKTQKEILFPTDYKIHYSTKMLETLFTLTGLSNASVKILELFNSEDEPSSEQITNKVYLQNSLTPVSPQVQTYYSLRNSDLDPLFSENENIDMIVMAAKNLNLCQKLLRSNSNIKLPLLKDLPLLVLHG